MEFVREASVATAVQVHAAMIDQIRQSRLQVRRSLALTEWGRCH